MKAIFRAGKSGSAPPAKSRSASKRIDSVGPDEVANFLTASTRIRRTGAKKVDPQSEEQLGAAALGMYASV